MSYTIDLTGENEVIDVCESSDDEATQPWSPINEYDSFLGDQDMYDPFLLCDECLDDELDNRLSSAKVRYRVASYDENGLVEDIRLYPDLRLTSLVLYSMLKAGYKAADIKHWLLDYGLIGVANNMQSYLEHMIKANLDEYF